MTGLDKGFLLKKKSDARRINSVDPEMAPS
jgi:hypothetical protein